MEYALVWLNRLSRALRLSGRPRQIQPKLYFSGLAKVFHPVGMGYLTWGIYGVPIVLVTLFSWYPS
jgi:hypothetical protein